MHLTTHQLIHQTNQIQLVGNGLEDRQVIHLLGTNISPSPVVVRRGLRVLRVWGDFFIFTHPPSNNIDQNEGPALNDHRDGTITENTLEVQKRVGNVSCIPIAADLLIISCDTTLAFVTAHQRQYIVLEFAREVVHKRNHPNR
jgi:hypothetical protein